MGTKNSGNLFIGVAEDSIKHWNEEKEYQVKMNSLVEIYLKGSSAQVPRRYPVIDNCKVKIGQTYWNINQYMEEKGYGMPTDALVNEIFKE